MKIKGRGEKEGREREGVEREGAERGGRGEGRRGEGGRGEGRREEGRREEGGREEGGRLREGGLYASAASQWHAVIDYNGIPICYRYYILMQNICTYSTNQHVCMYVTQPL